MESVLLKVSKFFKIKERKSTIRTELLAGATTFLAMAYILPVNTALLAKTDMPEGGIFFATVIASMLAALIMGLVANYPVALAPGMGINAFFTYTVVIIYGFSWEAALGAVFISGVLFLILSVSGLRKMVINAIPQGLKYAVGAGIGFFITFIGLQNAGIVVGFEPTLVELGDFSHPTVLLGLFGIVLVIVLYALGNKFALILAIIATAVVGLILNWIGVDMMPAYNSGAATEGLFTGAQETFLAAFRGMGELFSTPQALFIIFTFLFVDFFDTAGTLIAVGNQAGLINEDGELIDGNKALLADSIGTVAGSLLGTSTVTSYIESSTGIEQGGRTGLTAVTVAVLFLLSLLVYPVLSVFTGVVVGFDSYGDPIVYAPVTSMALVMVGAFMIKPLKNIDWDDVAILIPAFLTIVFMVFAFSIAEGIAVGFIFYPIIMLCTKRGKEVSPIMYALMAFFIIFFILNAVV
ncbi:MAG: NCS2 family permease [Acholeplasmatales bacterium]|nr:MAG: NCS2 family permease [Acholeplasmatales bacterium]